MNLNSLLTKCYYNIFKPSQLVLKSNEACLFGYHNRWMIYVAAFWYRPFSLVLAAIREGCKTRVSTEGAAHNELNNHDDSSSSSNTYFFIIAIQCSVLWTKGCDNLRKFFMCSVLYKKEKGNAILKPIKTINQTRHGYKLWTTP